MFEVYWLAPSLIRTRRNRQSLVHCFSTANRPIQLRKKIPVYHHLFAPPVNSLWKSKFDAFNHMQSEISNMLAHTDDNLVVSAPTGAGKTAVFEMAMARFFQVDLQQPNHPYRSRQVSKHRKIVYVSPSKALCEERFEDWSRRIREMNLGIHLSLITGDGDPGEAYADLSSSQLVLTTPEKWDSMTRRWTENFYLFATVKLLLVDEVHLIAADSRGYTLESIICKMKSIYRATQNLSTSHDEIRESR